MADGSGDDAVVAKAGDLAGAGAQIVVVTSDRELAQRVQSLDAGIRVEGARWLIQRLDPSAHSVP